MKRLLEIIPEKYTAQLIDLKLSRLEELRLRVGQPLALYIAGNEEFFWPKLTQGDLESALLSACRQSVYAHTETLRHGYITVEGGHRIGVCGFGVVHDDSVRTIKSVSSMVIRVAKQILGCADTLLPSVTSSTLIIGPPGSGKTTLLRDLVRQMSDKKKQRVGLADERGEVSAGVLGIPQLMIGARTDVLINIPKATAAMMLLRTMNPQWIAMDEITSPRDLLVMEQVAYCGVSLLATAHAERIEDLSQRPLYQNLMERRIFEKVVVLRADKTYTVQEVAK